MKLGGFHIAVLNHAHPVLKILAKACLMGFEARGVGRLEPKPRAGGFGSGTDCLGLVIAEVIHDDDVAEPQGPNELFFGIG